MIKNTLVAFTAREGLPADLFYTLYVAVVPHHILKQVVLLYVKVFVRI